jgi:hypothetical protein
MGFSSVVAPGLAFIYDIWSDPHVGQSFVGARQIGIGRDLVAMA